MQVKTCVAISTAIATLLDPVFVLAICGGRAVDELELRDMCLFTEKQFIGRSSL
jgi:hypothetical protein